MRCQPERLLIFRDRVIVLAGSRQSKGQTMKNVCVAGSNLSGLFEMGNACSAPAGLCELIAKAAENVGIVGVEGNGVLEFDEGAARVTLFSECESKILVSSGLD